MIPPRAGRWLVAALVLGTTACDTPQPARRPQGLGPGEELQRGRVPVALPNPAPTPPTPPSPAASKSALPSPFAQAAPNPGALMPQGGDDAGAQGSEDAGADAGAGPPRDYPSELRALLGQPASCLDLTAAESSGGRLTITAVATVSVTGRVTRATVNAPNQPATALRCLQQRLTSGSLRGPIPNAPIEITSNVVVEIYVPPPQPPPPQTPEPPAATP